ncbi:MAG: alpha/beta hydrolase family esterase [Gemmatimonadota bacterium]
MRLNRGRRAPARIRAAAAAGGVLTMALTACRPVQGPAGAGPAAGGSAPAESAAASAAAVPAGSSEQTITAGGVARTFRLYRPAGLTGAAPLVVVLHGGFGSGSQAERSYRWDAQADRGRFLVAYPDGLNRAWNAGGGCCGTPARTGTDDTGFITAMIAAIERQTPVDRARIYATGISNGGIMAYRLACDTRIFAAIGPVAATQLGPCPAPAPVSVIHIHGTADRNIPYQGGPGAGVAHIDGPAVPALNATWRGIDHCAAPSVTTAGAVTTSVASCPGGRTVELITVAGAGHQWPGSVPRPFVQRLLHLDPPSTALNATGVIWRFFAAHRK